MDDPAGVGVLERVAERRPDPDDVPVREPLFGEQLSERAAKDQFGNQVDGVGLAGRLVERDDPRVGEPRGGLGLPLGPRRDLGAGGADRLDGDQAVELLVVGLPDHAEAAGAEAAHEAVATHHEAVNLRAVAFAILLGRLEYQRLGAFHHR